MDLPEYLRLFRRRWKLLAACVVLAGLAAFVTTPSDPANDNLTYTATHELLRDASAFAPPALSTVALFVKTGEVPVRAADRLGYEDEPAVLAGQITLEPNDEVGTLGITAEGSTAREAARRANVFAEETLAMLGEQAAESQREQLARVNAQLASLQTEIDALDDQLDNTPPDELNGTLEAERDAKLLQYGAALSQQQAILSQPPPSAGFISLQPALPELAEVAGGGFAAPTSRWARTLLAMVIGFFLGLAAVLVVERLDTRLHDGESTAEAFELPVISEVPKAPRGAQNMILTDIDPMSALAESYRTLRSAVLLSPLTLLGLTRRNQRTEDPQVILVTSPAPGDGKTTTAANLAVAIAEAGRSVLVLACDFRRPAVHTYFDAPVSPGIADVLTGQYEHLSDVVRTTLVPGVSIAPSGSKLRSLGDVAAAGRDLIREARELADVVVIDTPPLLATNDASELIPAADAVIVVARMAKTTVDAANRTRFLLDRLGAAVAGVVALGVPDSGTDYSSYYVSSAPLDQRRVPPIVKRNTIHSDEISDRIGQFRGTGDVPARRPATEPPDRTQPETGPFTGEPEGRGADHGN